MSTSNAWACSRARSPSPEDDTIPQLRSAHVTYDGASDGVGSDQPSSRTLNKSPSKSPSKNPNINKALPPSPLVDQEQQYLHTNSGFRASDLNPPNSAASGSTSNASAFSRGSTKAQFRKITRNLMDSDAAQTMEMSNDNSYATAETPNSTSNLDNQKQSWNFSSEKVDKIMGPPSKPRHVPHAMSENNIQYLTGQSPKRPAEYYIPPYLREKDPKETNGLGRSPSPARGRTAALTDMMANDLPQVVEEVDNILEHPESSRKRSRSPHKKLFGENGWLSRSQSVREIAKDTNNTDEATKQESPKKGALKQWREKMKRHLRDMSETGQPILTRSTFAISLNPPAQAKIYGELELMLCVSGNKFLMDQYQRGRMSADSVAKVNGAWRAKNRPQVREFQYDQLTQRELVVANIKTFEFHGEAAQSPIALNGILHGWKSLAKDMSIRTFCVADTQVKKNLLDARRVLEMFGTPLITFFAFQELQNTAHQGIRDYQARKRAERERRERTGQIDADTSLMNTGTTSLDGGQLF